MSIPTAPGDTQAEGEPATQVAQNNAHIPQPQTSAIDPTHIDPPKGLDPTDQSQGRGHQIHKPSAYVCDITDGTFSSTAHVNVPTYP